MNSLSTNSSDSIDTKINSTIKRSNSNDNTKITTSSTLITSKFNTFTKYLIIQIIISCTLLYLYEQQYVNAISSNNNYGMKSLGSVIIVRILKTSQVILQDVIQYIDDGVVSTIQSADFVNTTLTDFIVNNTTTNEKDHTLTSINENVANAIQNEHDIITNNTNITTGSSIIDDTLTNVSISCCACNNVSRIEDVASFGNNTNTTHNDTMSSEIAIESKNEDDNKQYRKLLKTSYNHLIYNYDVMTSELLCNSILENKNIKEDVLFDTFISLGQIHLLYSTSFDDGSNYLLNAFDYFHNATKLAPLNPLPRYYLYITYLLLSTSNPNIQNYYLNMGKLYHTPNAPKTKKLKTLYSLYQNDTNTCNSILQSYHFTNITYLPSEKINIAVCHLENQHHSSAYKLFKELSNELGCNTTISTSDNNDWMLASKISNNYKSYLCSHVYNNLGIALGLHINKKYENQKCELYELVLREYAKSISYDCNNKDAYRNYDTVLSFLNECNESKLIADNDTVLTDTDSLVLEVENTNITFIAELNTTLESRETLKNDMDNKIETIIELLGGINTNASKDIYLFYKLFQMKLYIGDYRNAISLLLDIINALPGNDIATMDFIDEIFQQLLHSIDDTDNTARSFPSSDAMRSIISSSILKQENEKNKPNTIQNIINTIPSNTATKSSIDVIDDSDEKSKHNTHQKEQSKQPKKPKIAFGFGASLSSSSDNEVVVATVKTQLTNDHPSSVHNDTAARDNNKSITNLTVDKNTYNTNTTFSNIKLQSENNDTDVDSKLGVDEKNDSNVVDMNSHDNKNIREGSDYGKDIKNTSVATSTGVEEEHIFTTTSTTNDSISSSLPKLYKPGREKVMETAIVNENDIAKSKAYIKIADAYLSKQDYNLASKEFQKVLKLNPNSLQALLGYVTCLEKNGNYKNKTNIVDLYMKATKVAFSVSLEHNEKDDYFYYGNVSDFGTSGGLVESLMRKAMNIILKLDDEKKLRLLLEFSIFAHTPTLAADIHHSIGMQYYSTMRPSIISGDFTNKTVEEKERLLKAKTQFELSNNYISSYLNKNKYHISSCIELGFMEYYVYENMNKSKEYFNIVYDEAALVDVVDPELKKKIIDLLNVMNSDKRKDSANADV